jgi:hypothetical protein
MVGETIFVGDHEEGQEAGSWQPDTQEFPQYARPQEPAPPPPQGNSIDQHHKCRYSINISRKRPNMLAAMKKAKRPELAARYTRISTVRQTSRACPPPPLGIIVDQQH